MLLLLLLACTAAPTAWIGPTDDPRLTVGVAVDGDAVKAYACGEAELLAESRWFTGAIVEDAVHVEADGWSIALDLAGEHANGVIAGPDGPLAWTGEPVDAPGGIYAADDDGCATGVLVHGEDVRGTWCDAEGAYAQVEPPDTLVPDAEGALEVGVAAPDGWRTLRVHRVFAR